MRTKVFGLILTICFLTSGACFASPFLGTWKLDRAKSKIGRGTGRNDTVIYDWAFPARTNVTVIGVDAKGNPTRNEWTGRFDGKDYPVTGAADEDARAYTEVNDHTLNFTMKKASKPVLNGRIVVSADGKSRTVTTWRTTWQKHHKRTLTAVALYHKA